jgi:hypothetical protein
MGSGIFAALLEISDHQSRELPDKSHVFQQRIGAL